MKAILHDQYGLAKKYAIPLVSESQLPDRLIVVIIRGCMNILREAVTTEIEIGRFTLKIVQIRAIRKTAPTPAKRFSSTRLLNPSMGAFGLNASTKTGFCRLTARRRRSKLGELTTTNIDPTALWVTWPPKHVHTAVFKVPRDYEAVT